MDDELEDTQPWTPYFEPQDAAGEAGAA